MRLKINNLVCGYGQRTVVDGFSAEISSGEVLCLLGPNGVGKTTLFKTILGFLDLKGGEILLDDKDIRLLSRKEFARTMGYVPQAHVPPFPFKVIDVVIMGRTAYMGTFGSPSKKDRQVADEVLSNLGVEYLRDRIYTEISGGERQMVLIARALAQEPSFLMMDEPTSNLDFGNQVRVLRCISNLASQKGLGIIMTTHFPDHVFQCDGKVSLMERNNVFKSGYAEDIITAENMRDAYGIEVMIMNSSMGDKKISSCIPMVFS